MNKLRRLLPIIISGITIFMLSGCSKSISEFSAVNSTVTAEEKETIETSKKENSIELSKLNITLPEGWTRTGNDSEVFFQDENKETVGGLTLVGYYGEYNAALPNHSEIIDSFEIEVSPSKKGKSFTLKRSNPAADSDKTWIEIHAIIPLGKDNLAYDIWLISTKDINLTTLKLLGIIRSIH